MITKTKGLNTTIVSFTAMLKQISVKTLRTSDASLKQMYDEAQTYMKNIGFKKIELVSVTELDNTFRSFLFSQGKEKVLLEYRQDKFEEILNLGFTPMEIKFVYDILLLRFNQLAKKKKENIFIFES